MYDNNIYRKIKTVIYEKLKDRLLEGLYDEVNIKFQSLRVLRLQVTFELKQ